MKLLFIFVSLISLFTIESWAGEWKFRAREHYEIHDISVGNQEFTYKGFSNTLNFWYEDPFNYSLGLAAGPLLGSSRIDGTAPAT
ncbi:MAG: hypothetical protein MJK18_07180, partial [Bdellovibrionales bacterium]|nr:hypothetical protein [Bdellovibrionales bacterium]